MTPQPLGSRYLLEDPIGQGGMGVVWRGRDKATGDPCAIKLLRPEFAADPTSVARFVRERTALVRFRHPNVVTLRDMIVEGDYLALVMDLVEGGDLDTYRRSCGGTLSPGESLGLTAQICDALAAAHAAGIVHRDLKPANVLLDAGQVRLADFGIARIAGDSVATTAGAVIGTIAFMAPEVIRGQEPTAACDVYAVGITLYELLTGRRPFTGEVVAIMHGHLETVAARPDGMPGRLWALISACLDKDPGARPPAAALARALRDPALVREPGLPREPALYGYTQRPAASIPGAAPWTPSGTGADGPQLGLTYVPRSPGPVTASAVLTAASQMPQGRVTGPGGAGEPPRADRRGGHRGTRRPGRRAVQVAVVAAALVFAGALGVYLATSGSTAGKVADPASSLAATTNPATASPTKTAGKSAAAASAAATAARTQNAPAAPEGTPGPVGPNLLADGDFTEPNLDAWKTVSNSFLVAGKDGETKAAQMSGPLAGVNQVVTGLRPGRAYELSGWIISDTGNDTTMIGVKNFNGTDGISRRVSSATWTEVTMTFTPAAGHTSAEVFCWQVVAGNGYCTNLSLQVLG